MAKIVITGATGTIGQEVARALLGAPEWMADALVGLEFIKSNSWAAPTTNTVEELTGHPPETYRAFFERNKARLSA